MVLTRSTSEKEKDVEPEHTATPTDFQQDDPPHDPTQEPTQSQQVSVDNTVNLAEAIMLMTETLKNCDTPSTK